MCSPPPPLPLPLPPPLPLSLPLFLSPSLPLFLSPSLLFSLLLFPFSIKTYFVICLLFLQYIQYGRNLTATVLRALEVTNAVDNVSEVCCHSSCFLILAQTHNGHTHNGHAHIGHTHIGHTHSGQTHSYNVNI